MNKLEEITIEELKKQNKLIKDLGIVKIRENQITNRYGSARFFGLEGSPAFLDEDEEPYSLTEVCEKLAKQGATHYNIGKPEFVSGGQYALASTFSVGRVQVWPVSYFRIEENEEINLRFKERDDLEKYFANKLLAEAGLKEFD